LLRAGSQRCYAWALDLYGSKSGCWQGGYKSYRRWVFRQFEEAYRLWVVGGMTGSGKTACCGNWLLGEQVIDLEDLAQHRLCVWYAEQLVQPTQEQFENNLAEA